MSAYVIFTRESPIRDPEAMAEYRNGNRSGGGGNHAMKPLVVYGAMEAVEGDAPDGIVILEFPSVEEAKAWYYSPEYQARVPLRRKAADYSAVIVEGL